jgi:hypothetical protein
VPYSQENDDESDAAGPRVYLPTDDSGNVFGTAVCMYQDTALPPKIFLISDPDTGLDLLKSADVKYSITGGDVKDCFVVSLGKGDETPDNEWNSLGKGLDLQRTGWMILRARIVSI